VEKGHRCDGIWDCAAGEDELWCDNVCKSAWQFACKSGQCVDRDAYCDGRKDCEDGTDELNECLCHKSGRFACASGSQCVSRLKVCDGARDCRDGSDEWACFSMARKRTSTTPLPSTTVRREQTFTKFATANQTGKSTNSTQVDFKGTSIHAKSNFSEEAAADLGGDAAFTNDDPRVDDYRDYDVRLAPSLEPPLYDIALEIENQLREEVESTTVATTTRMVGPHRVRVYPERQQVHVGHDAVLQCRDEGYARAEVSWHRRHNRPLPPNSEQDRGRLTIWKAAAMDRGVYVCRVKGHSTESGSSGTEARSFLAVSKRP